MPSWKRRGYLIRRYLNDHWPRHVHIFRDGKPLDRFDLESWTFMDETIGLHRGRVLKVLEELAAEGSFDE